MASSAPNTKNIEAAKRGTETTLDHLSENGCRHVPRCILCQWATRLLAVHLPRPPPPSPPCPPLCQCAGTAQYGCGRCLEREPEPGGVEAASPSPSPAGIPHQEEDIMAPNGDPATPCFSLFVFPLFFNFFFRDPPPLWLSALSFPS